MLYSIVVQYVTILHDVVYSAMMTKHICSVLHIEVIKTRFLTHWGWDWMAAISWTLFSNAIFEWKLLNFKYCFIEICFLGSNWQYFIIDSNNGLASNRRQAIIGTNVGLVYRHIYASLGLNSDLSCKGLRVQCWYPCTNFVAMVKLIL